MSMASLNPFVSNDPPNEAGGGTGANESRYSVVSCIRIPCPSKSMLKLRLEQPGKKRFAGVVVLKPSIVAASQSAG